MKRLIPWTIGLLLVCLITAPPAWCADITGGLHVHVKTAEKETPIQGATVRVQDKQGQHAAIEKKTGADGNVEFDNLQIGDYNVQVSQPDYETDAAVVRVTVGSAVEFNSLLDLKGKEKKIVVKENRLYVNKNSATNQGTTRNTDFQTRIVQNDMQSIVNTTPGVQGDAVGQFHPRGEHKGVSLSVDGVNLPIPGEASVNQIIDPRFLSTVDVQTGMFDASLGGNLGAVLNLATESGSTKPYAEVHQTFGTLGTYDTLAKFGGSANDGKFNYFLGGRWGVNDLRVDAPTPNNQTLGNHGRDENFLIHLTNKWDDDTVGLTLAYSNTLYGVPQTPQNFAAGVAQTQEDSNLFGVFSWKHKITDDDDTLLAVSYLKAKQSLTNNGVWTPFTPFPASVSADLASANAPLDPTNPGSPYLPTASLDITQVQPVFEYNHSFSANNKLKVGFTADIIQSSQNDNILDVGGGGGLPNPLGLATAPTNFLANINRSGSFDSAYVSETFKPVDFMTVNLGLRADYFNDGAQVKTAALSPRVNLAFGITDTQVVRLSYNRIFEPPPIEIDTSGLSFAVPQKTNQYEISYEAQPLKSIVTKAAFVYKDYHDQVDSGLLIGNSNIPIYAPVKFGRAFYRGFEISATSYYPTGLNGFVAATYGTAKPTAPGPFDTSVPDFNDHDQRVQVSSGLSYTWKKGPTASFDMLYGSGYPLDAVTSYNAVGIAPFGLVGERISRFIANLGVSYVPKDADGKPTRGWGWSLKCENLFDSKAVLGFLSSFSGTRFVQARRFLAEGSFHF